MAYTKFYPEGWKDNEDGATPITAASLNHMEQGIMSVDAALDTKQPKITGTKGSVVGFDDAGNPIPQAPPDTGVISFNGRSGAVTPQAGDYTAPQVGAIPLAMADSFAKKSDIAGAYIFRGSVATYGALPTTNLTAGDVYNVEEDGMNYGWTGAAWDALGSVFQLDPLTTAEIESIMRGSGPMGAADKLLTGAGLAVVRRIIDGTYLKLTGGTMKGRITVPDPIDNYNVVTKNYLDNEIRRLESILIWTKEKTARLSWMNADGTNTEVDVIMTRFYYNQYTLTYSGTLPLLSSGGANTFTIIPPPGYAFTNLAYTFVPEMRFSNGDSVIGSAVDGKIRFSVTSGLSGAFTLYNGEGNPGARLCLEVA